MEISWSGASAGTVVHVINSKLNINVDFSGAAIGGGGCDSGNDSDGGILIPVNSSIRTYIDWKAITVDSTEGDTSSSLWYYRRGSLKGQMITQPGVNGNAGITADIQDAVGNPLYLLELDTSSFGGSSWTILSMDQ